MRLAVILVLVAVQPGVAQEAATPDAAAPDEAPRSIAMQLDRIIPGTSYIYESTERGVYILTYLKGEDGGYIIEQRDGETVEDAPVNMTIHTDARGRWLRQVGAAGQEIIFEPHNCSRSLTYCEYSAIIAGEPDLRMAYQGSMDGDILRYEVLVLNGSPPQVMQEGSSVLDEDGITVSSTFSRGGGDVTHSINLLETNIPPPPPDARPEPSIILLDPPVAGSD